MLLEESLKSERNHPAVSWCLLCPRVILDEGARCPEQSGLGMSSVYILSSVDQSCPTLWDPRDCSMLGLPVHHQHPEFTQTHAIQPSHPPFSSCLQSFPASGSFPMSQFFAWGGQSIRVSASASVLPMNTQDWSPLGWTGWTSLQSKGLSRVFSNTTVQKHPFFGAQLSLEPNSHIHPGPLETP